jgi:tungstate transport system substrate-binding protein
MRRHFTAPALLRAAIAVLAVALVLGLALPSAASAKFLRRPTLSSVSTLRKVKNITLSGSTGSKTGGKIVTIQTLKPGRSFWVDLGSVTVNKRGRYSFRYRPYLQGTYYFRSTCEGRTSRLKRVRVRKGTGERSNIILFSTTSVRDAGIWNALKPMFLHACPEYAVDGEQWLGSGQSLTNGAELGQADVIIAHAPGDEINRVNQGYVKNRHSVMYNYFCVVGPKTGGATIPAGAGATVAFGEIAKWCDLQLPAHTVDFWSRNDNSGTNQAEMAYWKACAPSNPQYSSGTTPKDWYYPTAGFGMGKVLNSVNALPAGGYTLADRATWLFQSSTWTGGGVTNNLKIVASGTTSEWFNLYSVLEVVRARNPEGAADFSAWIRSPEAQAIIASYGKVQFPTEQLFYPYAGAF